MRVVVSPARKPWSRLFGAADLIAALVIGVGVFAGLPARWSPVDVPAAILVGLLGASGVLLVLGHPRALIVARIAAYVALAAGLVLVLLLALSASWLSGVYGPVGRGGALLLGLVAALVVPYLVFLPSAQLLWLGDRR